MDLVRSVAHHESANQMPVTPFHFGPGLLFKSLAPARVSLLAFVCTQVAIDMESGYNLYLDRYPVHTFLHTLLGGLVAAAAVTLALYLMRRVIPGIQKWAELRPAAVVAGAVVGSVSHSLLDAIMHSDVRLLAPWGEAGYLMGSVSFTVLHLSCTAAGVLGALILFIRYVRGNKSSQEAG